MTPLGLELIFLGTIALLPPLPAWIYARRAWTGRARRWANRYGTQWYSFQKLNYFPFTTAAFGVAWALTWIAIFLAGRFEGGGDVAIAIAGGAWVLCILLFFWWPKVLTPSWHQDWLARGGDKSGRDDQLWSPAERHAMDCRKRKSG